MISFSLSLSLSLLTLHLSLSLHFITLKRKAFTKHVTSKSIANDLTQASRYLKNTDSNRDKDRETNNKKKKILYARIANIPVRVSFFLSQSHLSFDSIQTYGCLLNCFRLFALDCLSCCEPLVFIRPVRAVPPRCLTRSAWRPENRWNYHRCPIAYRFFFPGVAAYGPSSPGRCPFLWAPTAVCTVEQHSVPQVRCCSSS